MVADGVTCVHIGWQSLSGMASTGKPGITQPLSKCFSSCSLRMGGHVPPPLGPEPPSTSTAGPFAEPPWCAERATELPQHLYPTSSAQPHHEAAVPILQMRNQGPDNINQKPEYQKNQDINLRPSDTKTYALFPSPTTVYTIINLWMMKYWA